MGRGGVPIRGHGRGPIRGHGRGPIHCHGSKDQSPPSKNTITSFHFRIDFTCNKCIAMVILSIK